VIIQPFNSLPDICLTPITTRSRLICVAIPPDSPDRQHQDPDVEPQRSVRDVGQVMVDTALHLLQRVGLAAMAVNLRSAGDARPLGLGRSTVYRELSRPGIAR
jgi:hypothetical protein